MSERAAESVRDGADDLIAGSVAHRVVDVFEPIDSGEKRLHLA